jgi:hypothetical protein
MRAWVLLSLCAAVLAVLLWSPEGQALAAPAGADEAGFIRIVTPLGVAYCTADQSDGNGVCFAQAGGTVSVLLNDAVPDEHSTFVPNPLLPGTVINRVFNGVPEGPYP